MNPFFTTRSTRFRYIAVFATIAASGLLSAVQAQPRAPLPGWPNTPERNGRWDNNNPWNEREVMSGEVVRRYSNTEYDLRAGDGHVFRVRSDDSISLNRGDDVRVSGDWRGSTFYARAITLIDRDNSYGNWGDGDWTTGFRSRINLDATVVRRYNQQTFEARTPFGRTYLIRGGNTMPNLRTGDQVRVVGFINGNRIQATQVSNLTRNGGVVGGGGWNNNNGGWNNGGWNNGNNGGWDRFPNGNNGNWGRPGDAGVGLDVNFPARITAIDRDGREATVVGENGRSYRVRTNRNELRDLRVGDRIRVRGEVRDNYISVDSLDRIR